MSISKKKTPARLQALGAMQAQLSSAQQRAEGAQRQAEAQCAQLQEELRAARRKAAADVERERRATLVRARHLVRVWVRVRFVPLHSLS